MSEAAAPSNPDSIQRIVTVAVGICLICAIFVAGSVVILRPEQAANKNLDTQRNILTAAGLYHEGVDVTGVFEDRIEVKLVDLRTGEIADPAAVGVDDVIAYDQRVATKDLAMSEEIPAELDTVQLKRKAHFAKVYLIKKEDGSGSQVVLPISGYGLWSVLYGYLVLDSDYNTVVGITFTDHGETPGLGAEVDNPKWKAQWPGKQIYDDAGKVVAHLKKGGIDAANPFDKQHLVDGLAGATLTSNGVNRMLEFWLGENGFGPFLTRLRAERA